MTEEPFEAKFVYRYTDNEGQKHEEPIRIIKGAAHWISKEEALKEWPEEKETND